MEVGTTRVKKTTLRMKRAMKMMKMRIMKVLSFNQASPNVSLTVLLGSQHPRGSESGSALDVNDEDADEESSDESEVEILESNNDGEYVDFR